MLLLWVKSTIMLRVLHNIELTQIDQPIWIGTIIWHSIYLFRQFWGWCPVLILDRFIPTWLLLGTHPYWFYEIILNSCYRSQTSKNVHDLCWMNVFNELFLKWFLILFLYCTSHLFDKGRPCSLQLLLCSWPYTAKRASLAGSIKFWLLSLSISLSHCNTPHYCVLHWLCVLVVSSLGFLLILQCRGNQFT